MNTQTSLNQIIKQEFSVANVNSIIQSQSNNISSTYLIHPDFVTGDSVTSIILAVAVLMKAIRAASQSHSKDQE